MIPLDAVEALVDTILAGDGDLPGVGGDAGTAARFAGSWCERKRVGAVPLMGQRLYEVDRVVMPGGIPGMFRRATAHDRDALIRFITGFSEATGERTDAQAMVDARLPLGQFWLWDHDGPVSMAALSGEANGVVRVQAVFTPDDQRGHGFASACVAELSQRALDGGHRCILYTDLGNATSNAIYRAIGYQAVDEALRYAFRWRICCVTLGRTIGPVLGEPEVERLQHNFSRIMTSRSQTPSAATAAAVIRASVFRSAGRTRWRD
ncbi:MAG: GNAT family N-acetyltransferase [Ilumatobacteraceae bacterium]